MSRKRYLFIFVRIFSLITIDSSTKTLYMSYLSLIEAVERQQIFSRSRSYNINKIPTNYLKIILMCIQNFITDH